MAEVKDALEIAPYEEPVGEFAQRADGKGVADLVADSSALPMSLERVGVMPEPVWALELHVDESLPRLPGLDAGQPAHGDMVQPEPVLDEGAAGHLDWLRGDDAKAQPRGRDPLEVGGVRVELEDVLWRAGNDLLT